MMYASQYGPSKGIFSGTPAARDIVSLTPEMQTPTNISDVDVPAHPLAQDPTFEARPVNMVHTQTDERGVPIGANPTFDTQRERLLDSIRDANATDRLRIDEADERKAALEATVDDKYAWYNPQRIFGLAPEQLEQRAVWDKEIADAQNAIATRTAVADYLEKGAYSDDTLRVLTTGTDQERNALLGAIRQHSDAQRGLTDFDRSITDIRALSLEPSDDVDGMRRTLQYKADIANQRIGEISGALSRTTETQRALDATSGNVNPVLGALYKTSEALQSVAQDYARGGTGPSLSLLESGLSPAGILGPGILDPALNTFGYADPKTQMEALFRTPGENTAGRIFDTGVTVLNTAVLAYPFARAGAEGLATILGDSGARLQPARLLESPLSQGPVLNFARNADGVFEIVPYSERALVPTNPGLLARTETLVAPSVEPLGIAATEARIASLPTNQTPTILDAARTTVVDVVPSAEIRVAADFSRIALSPEPLATDIATKPLSIAELRDLYSGVGALNKWLDGAITRNPNVSTEKLSELVDMAGQRFPVLSAESPQLGVSRLELAQQAVEAYVEGQQKISQFLSAHPMPQAAFREVFGVEPRGTVALEVKPGSLQFTVDKTAATQFGDDPWAGFYRKPLERTNVDFPVTVYKEGNADLAHETQHALFQYARKAEEIAYTNQIEKFESQLDPIRDRYTAREELQKNPEYRAIVYDDSYAIPRTQIYADYRIRDEILAQLVDVQSGKVAEQLPAYLQARTSFLNDFKNEYLPQYEIEIRNLVFGSGPEADGVIVQHFVPAEKISLDTAIAAVDTLVSKGYSAREAAWMLSPLTSSREWQIAAYLAESQMPVTQLVPRASESIASIFEPASSTRAPDPLAVVSGSSIAAGDEFPANAVPTLFDGTRTATHDLISPIENGAARAFEGVFDYFGVPDAQLPEWFQSLQRQQYLNDLTDAPANVQQAFDAFPRLNNPLVNQEIQNAAIAYYLTNREPLIDAYVSRFGDRVANSDLAKDLFQHIGYRSVNADDVHTASAAIMADIWNRNLALNPEPDAILYAGGAGVGKTSAVSALLPELEANAAAILDSTLSNAATVQQRIQDALALGKEPHVVYIYREPLDAWENGVITRLQQEGRTVSISAFLATHQNSWNNVSALLTNPDVSVTLIDNSLGPGSATPMSVDKFLSISYPADLRSTLMQRTTNMFNQGRITREQYLQLIR